jgi:uncharacterized membrane protein SpoIIM required for sporulation
VALIFLTAGLVIGYVQVQNNPQAFYRIRPDGLAGDRGPQTSAKELLEGEIFAPWPGFERSFITFASYLFEHNSTIAILSFGLGFALGIPTLIFCFQNGQAMGAFISIHSSRDLTVDFLGWLSIHGVTEIIACLIAAAAGLGVAEKIFFPGRLSRLDTLAKEGRTSAAAMVGVIFMLLLAGILEGGFRQLIDSTFQRFFIGALTLFMWCYYFYFSGRENDS